MLALGEEIGLIGCNKRRNKRCRVAMRWDAAGDAATDRTDVVFVGLEESVDVRAAGEE